MLKIYLETTIFNFPFADDAPQYRDALHIANCSVEGLDVIVSLNFRHIVKMKTKIMCSAINALYGLKAPYIFAPQEVIDYERETHL